MEGSFNVFIKYGTDCGAEFPKFDISAAHFQFMREFRFFFDIDVRRLAEKSPQIKECSKSGVEADTSFTRTFP